MNNLVAQWLKENITLVRRGRGEELYTKFSERFGYYSFSYLTDCLLEVLSFDEVLSMFKSQIPDGCFKHCELGVAYIPDNITYIGSSAFSESEIKSISLPAAIFGVSVLKDCVELEYADIRSRSGITSDYKTSPYMFSCCYSLTTVTLDIPIISTHTCASCTKLTDVVLRESVTSIQANAFRGCVRLKSIVYLGTIEQFNKIKLDPKWANGSSIHKIICTDGDIKL